MQRSTQRFETAAYAGHAVALDRDRLLSWLDAFLAEHGCITARQFKLAHNCTLYQARKTLNALCGGLAPHLVRRQVATTYVYTLAPAE